MSGTVTVWSDISIRIETGLRLMEFEGGALMVGSGPNFKCAQLVRGENHGIDAALIREWLRKNKFLECVKEKRIRIVDSVSPTVTEETAA
jgi:hypothetical protein